MTKTESINRTADIGGGIELVTLNILWSRLVAIAEEQARSLIRAAFSPLLRETEDISCGIFNQGGEMLVQAVTGTPGHINTMARGLRHFLEKFPPHTLEEGDVLITNDPWLISGHKHDVTIVTPIFRNDSVVGYAANTCHHSDIGGRIASADCREVFEEGLHLPILKLFRRGERDPAVFDIIESNVRLPEQLMGDLLAQVAGNAVSARRVVELLKEYGLEDLEGVGEEILVRSEEAMRAAVDTFPEGVFRNSLQMDGFDEPLTLSVALYREGRDLVVDYTGTSGQVPFGINVVLNYAYAYSIFPIKCALCPDLPHNAGAFRPIRLVAPEGCLVNAQYPAPVTSRHLTGHLLTPTVFGALGKTLPDRVVAENSSETSLQIDGLDDEGKRYISVSFFNGGMGARPAQDGISTLAYPTNIANTPMEVTESLSPLRFLERRLITDSGGAGRYRGGCGQVVSVKVLSQKGGNVSCKLERTRFAPRGYANGRDGSLTELTVNKTERPHPKRPYPLNGGDVVTLKLSGGGGFYPPEERPPELVARDVQLGLVSLEAAREIYRVSLDERILEVDPDRTRALRNGKMVNRKP